MIKHIISGYCSLNINKNDGGDCLKLDILGITIEEVKYNKENLEFNINEFTAFGKELVIKLPNNLQNTFNIDIKYKTGETPCLCWLNPAQTAGKKLPYLFTQGQACLNRGLFPSQDTPSVRSTFDAKIKVLKPYNVVMSANRITVFFNILLERSNY